MSFNLSSFDTGLYNLSADNPAPINVPTANLVGGAFTRGGEFSLSAANNSVQVLNTGTIGSSLEIHSLFFVFGELYLFLYSYQKGSHHL